jgi:hypothetical protein
VHPDAHRVPASPLRRRPYGGRVHTRARVAGVLILAATALAGCASATPGTTSTGAGTPPITPAPATTAPATSAEAAPTASPPTASITLPWPVSGAAKVAALQQAVDGGAQPWLLDPTEVALSYAAARGWTGAQAAASGTSGVTVQSSAGTHALALAQPGRKGDAGIWVVTSDSSR